SPRPERRNEVPGPPPPRGRRPTPLKRASSRWRRPPALDDRRPPQRPVLVKRPVPAGPARYRDGGGGTSGASCGVEWRGQRQHPFWLRRRAVGVAVDLVPLALRLGRSAVLPTVGSVGLVLLLGFLALRLVALGLVGLGLLVLALLALGLLVLCRALSRRRASRSDLWLGCDAVDHPRIGRHRIVVIWRSEIDDH